MQIDQQLVQTGARLGEGSYGVCFRGQFRGIDAVIKTLKTPERNDVLVREAKVMLQLLSHPNLPTLFGICHPQDNEPAKLVMQLYRDGSNVRTLRQALKDHVNFDGRNFFHGLAGGLSAIHESGYVHNDLHGKSSSSSSSSSFEFKM